jgi:hypothetical protein
MSTNDAAELIEHPESAGLTIGNALMSTYGWSAQDANRLVDAMRSAAKAEGAREAVERIRTRLLPMLGTSPWGIRHLTEHDLTSVLDEEAD